MTTRLLIYGPALKRIEPALAPYRDRLELAVVGSDGAITLDGQPISDEAAQPQWLWFAADSGFTAGMRGLLTGALKSNRLTWVHTGAAGLDNPIWGQLVDKGAALSTGHGQAISIAEFVVGEVISHLQRIPERRAEQAAHRWTRLTFREMSQTTWLIVGFGSIGQAVAERVRAFGAKVIGCRRTPGEHPLADRMVSFAEVKSALPEADVVVLAAPLNSETRGLGDAAFFAAMKPASVLANVGRGGLLDEDALLAALDKGAPGFAVLDVFHTEPLPPESRFWDHPKVALNPHASSFGSGQTARNDALFLENLRRQFAGEPLLYPADARDLGR